MNGQTFDVTAFNRTSLEAPRRVLASSRHRKMAASWVMFGLSIGGAVASAYMGGMYGLLGNDYESDVGWMKPGAIGAAIGSGVTLLTGLLIQALWSEPTESFEQAYNGELRAELERRSLEEPKLTNEVRRSSKGTGFWSRR